MVTKIKPSASYLNQWLVSSHTDPDKEYKVSQRHDGTWACACPRWIFGKAPKADCKHIIGIKVAEPVDHKRTSRKAAEEFVRSAGRVQTAEPVFLLQTKRSITLID